MFNWVNAALGLLGVRLVQVSKPPRSWSRFLSHAKKLGFQPSLIVDVGAADGTPELYGAFAEAKYILIEPLAEFEPVLQKLCRRLDAQYVLASADESVGETEIFVHDDLFGSSLLGEVEGDMADGVKRKIPTIRLDDVLAAREEQSILLKIDVQGAELRVLRGALESLGRIDMIIMEVALISTMIDAPEFSDVIRFMEKIGFHVYDVLGGLERPLDGSLQQLDLVFVPKDCPWRTDRRFATSDQRRRMIKQGSSAAS
jgi:FkbM family methyltransferase